MITVRTQKSELLAAVLTLLVCLNGMDLINTIFMVGIGLAREMNPLAVWVLTHGGFWGLAAFKVLWVGGWVAFLWRIRIRVRVIAPVVLAYLALLTHQTYMMLRYAMPLLHAVLWWARAKGIIQ